jgi:hypothetical protein
VECWRSRQYRAGLLRQTPVAIHPS